jgi:uncharacterized protein involved in exopolysaccharide biosynthesis
MLEIENRRTMLGYDIDLTRIARTLLERRRLVSASILGTVLLAIVYLHLATYTYSATLMVSPVLSSSSDSISNKLGNLGGLASLAGINVGGDMGTQSFMLYQEGLHSRDVAAELAKDKEVMHVIFNQQWDAESKQWARPSGPMRAISTFIKGVIGIPVRPWQPPDGAQLQEYIADNVTVETDSQKPVVTITYRARDPQFAVKFLSELNQAADNKLRQNALVRANQYIDYVADQLNKITNTDVRQALMTTLTDQEKIKMMASATAPFAAEPFGLPSASRKPTSPKPFLVLAIAGFMGGLLGIMAALWLPLLRWSPQRFKKLFGKSDSDTGR